MENFEAKLEQFVSNPSGLGVTPQREAERDQLTMEFASLPIWATYLKGREAEALERLSWSFDLDCDFFLQQPWVRRLIVDLRKKGEQEKITQLFFGPGKRRRRSIKTIMEQEQRNEKICGEVERLRGEGHGYNESMRIVSDKFIELGLSTKISANAVRRIYEKRKEGYTPLKALFRRSDD